MKENDELKLVLALLIKAAFPQHFEICMNALIEINDKARELAKSNNIPMDDEEVRMRTIADALGYAALNLKRKTND